MWIIDLVSWWTLGVFLLAVVGLIVMLLADRVDCDRR
jgi:hypothetical protein